MKTPEEIKAGLRCHAVQWYAGECPDHEPGCKGCPYENDYHDPDELMADALELIEELQAKIPQWISVKERLPEKGITVLFATRNNPAVYRGRYNGAGDKGTHYFTTRVGRSNSGGTYAATHWMPLPEPPEEEV